MPATLRLATPDDAPGMLAIYGPIIRDTATSFETDVPTVTEFAERLSDTLPHRPWFVAVDGEQVLGYTYAGSHRARATYGWSVEPSIYVSPKAQRRGVARALYTALFAALRAQGFANAYAGITLPNTGSVALHERFGFVPVGVYPRIGFKHGQWHDVGWWRLDLAPDRTGAPEPPQPLLTIVRNGRLDAALAEGTGLLNP
jgi:L-amino acid N-acyltransferase YncA